MAAAETARLIASLELQDRNFTRGIKNVERGIGRVDKRLGAFSGFLNRNMARALDSFAARGVDALGDAIKAGSDLNEEITKSQAVFGAASKEIIAFSETTASALGLSQTEALAAAGNFGNMFKTIGLAEGASEDMSERLVTLAADMASFNNEDPSEMLDRLRSGLAGEAEPLRRFGVLISAARVQEEAYASGIAKRGEALTEQQKVQARYNLILKDTAVQQGDVAKTGGNLAGQQRKLNAMIKDASATIGSALLPAVTELTSEFVKLFQDPGTKEGLKAFAKDLGEGAKDLVASLKQVDWKAFASALGTAAGFARDLVQAFLGLPSWVQTAVITGWGLNKLTGGGVTNLLGKAFGKGIDLFSGRGSTPANPLFVSGVGVGGPGAPIGGGKGGGRFGGLARGAVGLAAGAVAVIGFERALAIWEETNQRSTEQARTASQNLDAMLAQKPNLSAMQSSLAAVNTGINQIQSNPLLTLVQGDALNELKAMRAKLEGEIAVKARPIIEKRAPVNAALNQASIAAREGGGKTSAEELKKIQAQATITARAARDAKQIASREASRNDQRFATAAEKQAMTKAAIDNARSIASRENSAQKAEIARAKNAAATAGRNTTTATNKVPPAVRGNAITVASSMAAAASRIVTAVNALDLSVNVTTVNRTSTINNRYGPSGGSSTTNRSGELE